MLIKNTIALSVAAVLISASAAMAATTHRDQRAAAQNRAAQADRDGSSYAAAVRSQNAVGPRYDAADTHYYEPSDNGSVWSYYPGYTSH
jgi:hypothetical protein